MRTSINTWLEKALESGMIDEHQIIAVYDKNNNIQYLGKAGFAPLNLWEEFKTATIVGHELRINERISEKIKTNATIKSIHNCHVTDMCGVTISDVFTVYYVSGVVRIFKCRNKLSGNAHQFIRTHSCKSESITDKNHKTVTWMDWEYCST